MVSVEQLGSFRRFAVVVKKGEASQFAHLLGVVSSIVRVFWWFQIDLHDTA